MGGKKKTVPLLSLLDCYRTRSLEFPPNLTVSIKANLLDLEKELREQLNTFLALTPTQEKAFGRVEILHVELLGELRFPAFELLCMANWFRMFFKVETIEITGLRYPLPHGPYFLPHIAYCCPTIQRVILNETIYSFPLTRMASLSSRPSADEPVSPRLDDDLYPIIFDTLSPRSFLAVLQVSRKFQQIALPLFLKKFYNTSITAGTLRITLPATWLPYTKDALSGLLLAVTLRCVNNLHLKFEHADHHDFVRFTHIQRVQRFISRLDSCQNVSLEFWRTSASPHVGQTVFESQRWVSYLFQLLDTIASRGCQSINVIGGPYSAVLAEPRSRYPRFFHWVKPASFKDWLRSPLPVYYDSQKFIPRQTRLLDSHQPPEIVIFKPNPPQKHELTKISIDSETALGYYAAPLLAEMLQQHPVTDVELRIDNILAKQAPLRQLVGCLPNLKSLHLRGSFHLCDLGKFLIHVPHLENLVLAVPWNVGWYVPPANNAHPLTNLKSLHAPITYFILNTRIPGTLPNLQTLTLADGVDTILSSGAKFKTVCDWVASHPNQIDLHLEMDFHCWRFWVDEWWLCGSGLMQRSEELSVPNVFKTVSFRNLYLVDKPFLTEQNATRKVQPLRAEMICQVLDPFVGFERFKIWELEEPSERPAKEELESLRVSILSHFPDLREVKFSGDTS